MPELANQVSGVVLLLLAALRQTYADDDGGAEDASGEDGNYVTLLDAGKKDEGKKSVVYSSALHVILKGLVQWIGNTSESLSRLVIGICGVPAFSIL